MPHFHDMDPFEPYNRDHYDDHDVDHGEINTRSGLGPYRPMYPIREGFTMGVMFMLVLGLVIWLFSKAMYG